MPFNMTAHFTAAKGRADEVEKLVRAVKADVVANEPGTLSYITTRGVDNDHDFVIFEEYEDVAAQEKHREGKPYNEFKKAIVETGLLDGGLKLTKTAEF